MILKRYPAVSFARGYLGHRVTREEVKITTWQLFKVGVSMLWRFA